MQDKVLASLAVDVVVRLLVLQGSQSCHGQRLGLAAGEQGASVRSGQNVHFASNRADFVALSSVDAHSFVQNGLAQKLVLDVVEQGVKELFLGFVLKLLGVFGGDLLFHGLDGFAAGLLAGAEVGFLYKRSGLGFDFGGVGQCHVKRRERKLFLSGLLYQLFLKQAHVGDELLRLVKGSKHHFLAGFVGAAFYHSEAVFCSGHYDFKLSLFLLLERGVDDVFSVQVTYAASGDRSVEGNVRN